MSFLEEYNNYNFDYEGEKNPIYSSFQRKYKNYLLKNLPRNYSLHSFNNGYYEFSCVIQSDTNEFIYLSIPDVRSVPDGWKNNILIRQMEHDKDWRGKSNYYTRLENLKKDLEALNNKGYITSYARRYAEAEM